MSLKGFSLVMGILVAAATLIGISNQMWSSLGWVTHSQYEADRKNYVTVQRFEEHVGEFNRNVSDQKALNDRSQQTLNEILAQVKIVPQLKALIRSRCMGSIGLDITIEDLKRQFLQLTGRAYEEPTCNDPTIRTGP